MSLAASFLTFFLLLPSVAFAQGANRLTMLEGSLKVIRGTSVYKASEGAALHQGDMLESGPEAGFAQLELEGGAIVVLGPSTKVYLYRLPAGRGANVANLVLLQGWLKAESNGSNYRYSTPLVAVATGNGAVVLHQVGESCEVTIEAGTAAIGETNAEGAWKQSSTAKAFQFVSRSAGKNITSTPRPTPAFVSAMPQAFKDTLPSRLAHFAHTKPIEPKLEHPVTFVDLQPWLALPVNWRRSFVERFTPCLKDPDFRREMDAHVAQYPEWDPVLHPEKYQKQEDQPTTQKQETSPTR
jgi:hypothetical protein